MAHLTYFTIRRFLAKAFTGVLVVTLLTGLSVHASSPASVTKTNTAAKASGKESSNEPIADTVYVPSVFVDVPGDPKFGKDLFFPRTMRFQKKPDTSSKTLAQLSEAAVVQSLVLKGISGVGTRRLALLNNRTLGIGEVWDYKLNGLTYRIRCEEIKPRSVLISIEGVTENKEIHLRGSL
ncbi:MAG: hypothetical protein FJ405_04225 [Verrucomicrobia bacterium]|nr:hypothetical protein [Verrucomicrobiota bacterium]